MRFYHEFTVHILKKPLVSNVYTQEALINILEKKGLIDKAELLAEIQRLKKSTT